MTEFLEIILKEDIVAGPLIAVFVFTLVVFIISYIFSKDDELSVDSDTAIWFHKLVGRTGMVLTTLIMLGVITSGAWYEFPTKTGTIVTFDEHGTPKGHPFGIVQFRKYTYVPDYLSTDGSANSIIAMIRSQVSPITSNPKVRNIAYHVTPRILDQGLYLSDPARRNLRKEEASKKLRRTVERCLYDFNEVNSLRLSEFFNPLDEEQVKEFNSLVESWVNRRLVEDGVIVHCNGFSLL